MSRRSRHRRKLARSTILDSRETPRAVHTGDSRTRSYPGVHELLSASSGDAWRSFLESTLRSVLRPAALVSAVGIAAGCGGGAQTSGASITTDTTTVQSSSSSTTVTTATGATLVPMPQTGNGQVVSGHLPPTNTPPPTGPLHGTPNVVPIPHPIAVRGEAVAVDPGLTHGPTPLPTPEPIPLGGAPMPIQVEPQPQPQPQPQHHHHQQQQQAQPQPDPLPMPGGIAPVMPQS